MLLLLLMEYKRNKNIIFIIIFINVLAISSTVTRIGNKLIQSNLL